MPRLLEDSRIKKWLHGTSRLCVRVIAFNPPITTSVPLGPTLAPVDELHSLSIRCGE